MKLYIAGICGTFMAGIAQLAREAGHDVAGCDAGVYPPMSTLLDRLGIPVDEGYDHAVEADLADSVVIGNALSRGNPLVEHVLDHRRPHSSGPQWLHDNILLDRLVLAVAGTHGKTTTAAILNWILAGEATTPGYLIGGQPGNFDHSAALGDGRHFVIEADEYDTAFFDKRSKFVHYCPHVAVLNNLEFDHADIFDDLGQIARQFHHLVRIVPANGFIVINADDRHLADVIAMGCWSTLVPFSILDPDVPWFARPTTPDCRSFEILYEGVEVAQVNWSCIGRFNMQNALAAVVAASCCGVAPDRAAQRLTDFVPTARRMERLLDTSELVLYDDFAHHPTAIEETLRAARARHQDRQLIAIVEPRSNTMRMGHHGHRVTEALAAADVAFLYRSDKDPAQAGSEKNNGGVILFSDPDHLESELKLRLTGNDVIITMSNGSFNGLPARLANALATPA